MLAPVGSTGNMTLAVGVGGPIIASNEVSTADAKQTLLFVLGHAEYYVNKNSLPLREKLRAMGLMLLLAVAQGKTGAKPTRS